MKPSVFMIVDIQVVRCMSGGHDEHHKSELMIAHENLSSMDFYPVPEGSWQEAFDKKNSKLNIYLVATGVFFVVTTIFVSNCTLV